MRARTRLRLKWKQKAALFRLFSLLPGGGDSFQYFLRRKITRSLPRSPEACDKALELVLKHMRNLYGGGPPQGLYYEFGAGWDSFQNIALYCHGVDRQLLIDIMPLLRRELANDAVSYFGSAKNDSLIRQSPGPLGSDFRADLARFYGIDYQAPSDAQKVSLPDGSVRAIATTNTLEHIPFPVLRNIMRECRRLCAPDARLSMRIDYSDHYAHIDRAITPFNFLQFSTEEWARYNLTNHYQNRGRHPDYLNLFRDAGFEVVSEEVTRPPGWRELLRSVVRDRDYQGYDEESAAIIDALICLRPA